MATHKLTSLVAGRLGNHRSRRDFLGQATFPGLTIDNLPSTPIRTGSVTIGSQLADLSPQLAAVNALQQSESQLDADALVQRTARNSPGTPEWGSSISSLANGLLGGGLGLGSLVEGLLGLFGGGSQTLQPLTPFNLPSSIQYAAGVNGPVAAPAPIDFGQGGQIRTLTSGTNPSSGGSSGSGSSTVHVNVNALDSQSFLDHSDEIANAVRAAILNSHPLNDVIASL